MRMSFQGDDDSSESTVEETSSNKSSSSSSSHTAGQYSFYNAAFKNPSRESDTEAATNSIVATIPTQPPAAVPPSPNDVLLGRGARYQQHPGNSRYNDLIRLNSNAYFECDNDVLQKKLIVCRIVDEILAQGRFLQKVTTTAAASASSSTTVSTWTPISKESARRKVAHAIQYLHRKNHNSINSNNQTGVSAAAASAIPSTSFDCMAQLKEEAAAASLPVATSSVGLETVASVDCKVVHFPRDPSPYLPPSIRPAMITSPSHNDEDDDGCGRQYCNDNENNDNDDNRWSTVLHATMPTAPAAAATTSTTTTLQDVLAHWQYHPFRTTRMATVGGNECTVDERSAYHHHHHDHHHEQYVGTTSTADSIEHDCFTHVHHVASSRRDNDGPGFTVGSGSTTTHAIVNGTTYTSGGGGDNSNNDPIENEDLNNAVSETTPLESNIISDSTFGNTMRRNTSIGSFQSLYHDGGNNDGDGGDGHDLDLETSLAEMEW